MTTVDLFRWAETLSAIGAAWLLTYALHSTVLIAAIWGLQRVGAVRSLRLRDLAWRAALVGGLLTATIQMGAGLAPWGLTLEVPSPLATAQRASAPVDGEDPGLLSAAPAETLPPLLTGAPLTFSGPPADARSPRPDREPLAAVAFPEPAPDSDAASTVAIPQVRVGSLFFMAWAAVASALLLRLAVARARVVDRLGMRTPVLEPAVRAQLDRLCDEAGRTRPVQLTTAEGLKSPVALGWSEICIPAAVLTELDAAQQRSVLAHELAHLERQDPLWLLLGTALEQVLFFQPLNRLARRNIQEVAEYLCDDWAATRDGSGLPIARGLASVARWLDGEERAVPLAGMAETPSLLVTRVQRLLDASGISLEPRRSWHLWALALVLVLTVMFVPGVRAAPALGWFEVEPDELSSGGRSAPAAEAPAPAPEASPAPTAEPAPEATPSTATSVSSSSSASSSTSTSTSVSSSRLRRLTAQARELAKQAQKISRRTMLATTPVVKVAPVVLVTPPTPPTPPMPPTPPAPPRLAHNSRHRGKSSSQVDPATVDALIKALKDPDAGVRQAAADSLGRLRDPRALEGLAAAASDSDVKVRQEAVQALARLEDARAIPALAKALKDPSPAVRREAAEGLAQLDEAPGAIEPLVSALGDSDVRVRLAAVQGLAHRGDKRALGAIGNLVKDPAPEVRATAVAALGDLKDPASIPALTAALKDDNERVRMHAVRSLAQIGSPRAAPALIEATRDHSADVRAHAAGALTEVRDASNAAAVVAALKALLDDADADVREQAVDALSEIRDASAVQALIAAMQSKDPVVRKAAAAALGQRD